MESIASFYVYSALFYLCKISSSFKNSENETQDFFKKSFNLLIDNNYYKYSAETYFGNDHGCIPFKNIQIRIIGIILSFY